MITFKVCQWLGNISESKTMSWEYSNIEEAIKRFKSEQDLKIPGLVVDLEVRKDSKILHVFK